MSRTESEGLFEDKEFSWLYYICTQYANQQSLIFQSITKDLAMRPKCLAAFPLGITSVCTLLSRTSTVQCQEKS